MEREQTKNGTDKQGKEGERTGQEGKYKKGTRKEVTTQQREAIENHSTNKTHNKRPTKTWNETMGRPKQKNNNKHLEGDAQGTRKKSRRGTKTTSSKILVYTTNTQIHKTQRNDKGHKHTLNKRPQKTNTGTQ
jgi:hypothetical protein